ncbi:MAG: M1 family metallopeptidase, partial [Bacteroidota bacterium]
KPKQIWTQGETESNSAWYPTIDKPNMKTLIEIYMTVDTQYVTLSNGLMLDSKNNKNGTRTDHWKMDLPIAPYLVMMAVGDFKIVHDKWRNMPVDYYVEPAYAPYEKEIFGRTPEMIECYSKLLGVDYVWPKYSQIIVRDFVSGAMENTTAVVHYDALNQTHREMIDGNHDDIICHELFHHWFGDLVTCESWSNISLNESFADYSEALWAEHKNGKDAHDLQVYIDKNTYLLAAASNPVPLIRYHYESQEDVFDANSYQRGGYVLNMLRNYVGDEAFFKSLNVYLTENKFGTGEVHTLRMAFEKVTGEDLNWFFNEYYLSPGHPSVTVNYTYSDESNAEFVTIEQTQDTTTGAPVFRLPIDVDVYSGGETKRYLVVLNKARQTFSFPAYTKPDLINVDATKSILWEKTDNKSDSEFVFQFKHAPLFMDRYEAIEHFENEQDLDEPSRLALIDAMNDKFWFIRKSAVEMIALDDEKTITQAKPILVSLVKSDPNPHVRTAALNKLSGLTDEEMISTVTAITAKDSSYSVLGATLTVLQTHNPDKAYTLAESSKNEKSEDMTYSIATILSQKGGADDYPWFEDKLNTANGYAIFSVLTAMKTYLVNTNSETRMKGVDLLAVTALNDSKDLWVKLSASGVLSQIKNELELKRSENRSLDNDIQYIQKKLDEIIDKQGSDLKIQIQK